MKNLAMISMATISLMGCSHVVQDFKSTKGAYLVAHGASKHAVQGRLSGKPYNEVNPGGGARVDVLPTVAVQGGVYKNSYHKQSGYLIADWSPLQWRVKDTCVRFGGGTFGGIATNYNDRPVVPAVGLQSFIECGRLGIRTRVAPALRAKAVFTIEGYFRIFEW